jgi:hypothetical protein
MAGQEIMYPSTFITSHFQNISLSSAPYKQTKLYYELLYVGQ